MAAFSESELTLSIEHSLPRAVHSTKLSGKQIVHGREDTVFVALRRLAYLHTQIRSLARLIIWPTRRSSIIELLRRGTVQMIQRPREQYRLSRESMHQKRHTHITTVVSDSIESILSSLRVRKVAVSAPTKPYVLPSTSRTFQVDPI